MKTEKSQTNHTRGIARNAKRELKHRAKHLRRDSLGYRARQVVHEQINGLRKLETGSYKLKPPAKVAEVQS